MFRCCQETGSVRSNSQQYDDLETILQNLPYQQVPRIQTVKNAPNMTVSLDLPGYDMQYLPTYWPGQKITGQVKIQLGENNSSPIKVSHLRIALFGNVQVYGSYPGHPMTNGLFDYHKNEQLINTGLRIVRRLTSIPQSLSNSGGDDDGHTVTPSPLPMPSLPPTGQQQEHHHDSNTAAPNYNSNSNNDEEVLSSIGDERRWRLYCRQDNHQRGSTEEQRNNHSHNQRQSPTRNKPNRKTSEDRHIEKLIRKAAAIDHASNVSSGILDDDMECFYREEVSSAFELGSSNANSPSTTTNTIAFSIRVPTSRRLSGTFDHPHYPVSYRVVAIMKCRDKENNEITCYSTVKLRLESSLDINAPQYNKRIQSKPARHYVQSNNGILSGLCTFVLSSSSVLMHLFQKMTQKSSKVSPTYSSSYIQSHLELSRQGFERSQYIPLELKLSNHAAPSFKISAIKIYIELVRRINMTCSMNEEVEGKVLQTLTVVFKSIEEEESEDNNDGHDDNIVFFKHSNACFDLSKLIQVPDDCSSTIIAESTRNVFSLNYDLNVKVDITGVAQQYQVVNTNVPPPPTVHQEEIHYYYASDKHVLQEQRHDNDLLLPKEPYHQKFKTYTLQLEPLTVVIGNSNCFATIQS